MKKILFIALLLFFTGVAQNIKASHNRGGEITYKRIPPFSEIIGGVTVIKYTYLITVTKYTDHGPGVADRCVDTVYFGDGQRGIAPRINGDTVSCNCGKINNVAVGCGKVIINTVNASDSFIVKLNTYTITHTYPGPGSYLIRSFDPNRNQGVHNIPNSVSQPFYIESYLVLNSSSGSNSSPVLSSLAVAHATLNTCFIHSPNAIDADGDSLSYEITQSRGDLGKPVPGYGYPDPGPAGVYQINAVTGVLGWCNPQSQGEYALAYIVKEWRKNTAGVYTMIGYILRDMQVLVIYAPVGIHEQSLSDQFSISPNPVTDRISINAELPGELSYEIMTIQGSSLHAGTFNDEKKQYDVDCSSLAPGTYFIKIHSNENTVVKKIIKL